jgi:hypothetical protein
MRPLDHFPRDEPDEDGRGERRKTRDQLQSQIAEADTPPREGAAYVMRQVGGGQC